MKTLSSKLPWLAAKPTAASFPITCTATIVTASHWVGLTFPGMMEEPGSFSGMRISPRPSRGPEASQRTSLAIFIMSAAKALMAPWAKTNSSLLVSAWNLLGAVTKFFPVNLETHSATFLSKPLGALSPVPTAVPPRASCFKYGKELSSILRSRSRLVLQPEISCPKEIGTASCKWVRPLFTIFMFSFSSFLKVATRVSIAGKSLSSIA